MDSEISSDLEEPSSNGLQAQPALFTKCIDAYHAMEKESTKRHEGHVYEGSLTTTLERECGITTSNYSHVMGRLRSMGSVRQLARGGGGKGSLWLLLGEPTLEIYNASPRSVKGMQAKDPYSYQQKFDDMNRRIIQLERHIQYLLQKVKD